MTINNIWAYLGGFAYSTHVRWAVMYTYWPSTCHLSSNKVYIIRPTRPVASVGRLLWLRWDPSSKVHKLCRNWQGNWAMFIAYGCLYRWLNVGRWPALQMHEEAWRRQTTTQTASRIFCSCQDELSFNKTVSVVTSVRTPGLYIYQIHGLPKIGCA